MSPKRSRLLDSLNTKSGGAASSSQPAKKRKQLQRRDSEEKVERILASHFADFSAVDRDGTVRNGLTLRERLLQETRAKAKEGGRITAGMIKAIGLEYMSQGDPMRALIIESKDEESNQDLMKALASAEHTNPAKGTKTPLYSYLGTCDSLNQKEVVVVLRTIIGTSPASSVALSTSSRSSNTWRA